MSASSLYISKKTGETQSSPSLPAAAAFHTLCGIPCSLLQQKVHKPPASIRVWHFHLHTAVPRRGTATTANKYQQTRKSVQQLKLKQAGF